MSRWTHALCDRCWGALEGERIPSRVREADRETCCRCGGVTFSGIYYRADPASMTHCDHTEEVNA